MTVEISTTGIITIAIMAAPLVVAWVMDMRARKKRDNELFWKLRNMYPDMSSTDLFRLWEEKRRNRR